MGSTGPPASRSTDQGRIVAAGRSFNGTNDDFAVARYAPNGTLDTGFNGTGKVTTSIGTGDDEANAVAIDGAGRIVVGGTVFNPSADFGLARYRPDGTLDTSFNGVGKVTTSLTAGNDVIRGVAIDQRERIVAAGDTGNDFALARYIGDTVPPKVTFGGGGPPPGSFTNDPTPTFTFSSSESGSTFACGIDAIPPTACSSPFTVGTALADGAHSVSIVATDKAGNPSAAVKRTFTVDTTEAGAEDQGEEADPGHGAQGAGEPEAEIERAGDVQVQGRPQEGQALPDDIPSRSFGSAGTRSESLPPTARATGPRRRRSSSS